MTQKGCRTDPRANARIEEKDSNRKNEKITRSLTRCFALVMSLMHGFSTLSLIHLAVPLHTEVKIHLFRRVIKFLGGSSAIPEMSSEIRQVY